MEESKPGRKPTAGRTSPALSIVIVSFNTRELLLQCLESLLACSGNQQLEIFVVDNASNDKSAEAVTEHFPGVKLIALDENAGYARANNHALEMCSSDYILLLNPDTIVDRDTLTVMLDFMETHETVGIVSCKVELPDGSLDKACRRSIPTPESALYRMLWLHRLFPRSRRFSRYNLSWLDPNRSTPVEAVCGAFLLTRKAVLDEIGFLDERFFMYGEDLDFCLRCRDGGWSVFYHPEVRIVHYKRASSSTVPGKMTDAFHDAMVLFYKKHYAQEHGVIYNGAVITGIRIRSLLSKTINRLDSGRPDTLD